LIIIDVRNRNWPASHATTCLLFIHSEGWITLSMLVHIIPSNIILTYGLVIDVVMTIDESDQCTTVRSLGQIQQKSTKEWEGRYTFQWLWMKWRVISIGCQLEVELVPVQHDLDCQSVYIFCRYICQNNWILIALVIF
jgi:hypothetical protein